MAMEEDMRGKREGIHTHPPSRSPPVRAALRAVQDTGRLRERRVWSPVSHLTSSPNPALQGPGKKGKRERDTASQWAVY